MPRSHLAPGQDSSQALRPRPRTCDGTQAEFKADVTEEQRSAARAYERPHAQGVQFHAEPLPGEVVGQPYQHMAADLQVRALRLRGPLTIPSPNWQGRDELPLRTFSNHRIPFPYCCLSTWVAFQVTGEATYTDDMALPSGSLVGVCVTSTKPHAKLLKVDASKALEVRLARARTPPRRTHCCCVRGRAGKTDCRRGSSSVCLEVVLGSGFSFRLCGDAAGGVVRACALCAQVPGVHGYFSSKDVPGSNMIGPVVLDEEVFATETVTCVGQVRGRGAVGCWTRRCLPPRQSPAWAR